MILYVHNDDLQLQLILSNQHIVSAKIYTKIAGIRKSISIYIWLYNVIKVLLLWLYLITGQLTECVKYS